MSDFFGKFFRETKKTSSSECPEEVKIFSAKGIHVCAREILAQKKIIMESGDDITLETKVDLNKGSYDDNLYVFLCAKHVEYQYVIFNDALIQAPLISLLSRKNVVLNGAIVGESDCIEIKAEKNIKKEAVQGEEYRRITRGGINYLFAGGNVSNTTTKSQLPKVTANRINEEAGQDIVLKGAKILAKYSCSFTAGGSVLSDGTREEFYEKISKLGMNFGTSNSVGVFLGKRIKETSGFYEVPDSIIVGGDCTINVGDGHGIDLHANVSVGGDFTTNTSSIKTRGSKQHKDQEETFNGWGFQFTLKPEFIGATFGKAVDCAVAERESMRHTKFDIGGKIKLTGSVPTTFNLTDAQLRTSRVEGAYSVTTHTTANRSHDESSDAVFGLSIGVNPKQMVETVVDIASAGASILEAVITLDPEKIVDALDLNEKAKKSVDDLGKDLFTGRGDFDSHVESRAELPRQRASFTTVNGKENALEYTNTEDPEYCHSDNVTGCISTSALNFLSPQFGTNTVRMTVNGRDYKKEIDRTELLENSAEAKALLRRSETKIAAHASDLVYKLESIRNTNARNNKAAEAGFSIIKISNDSEFINNKELRTTRSGYFAVLLKHNNSRKYYLANMGTEPINPFGSLNHGYAAQFFADIRANASTIAGIDCQQFRVAVAFANFVKILPVMRNQQIITTGHSKGKILADIQALTLGCETIGFDGPRIPDTVYEQYGTLATRVRAKFNAVVVEDSPISEVTSRGITAFIRLSNGGVFDLGLGNHSMEKIFEAIKNYEADPDKFKPRNKEDIARGKFFNAAKSCFFSAAFEVGKGAFRRGKAAFEGAGKHGGGTPKFV